MSDVFIVETKQHTAGIAVREEEGFRFHAAAPPFFGLDNHVFPSYGALHAAVAANDNAGPGRQGRGR